MAYEADPAKPSLREVQADGEMEWKWNLPTRLDVTQVFASETPKFGAVVFAKENLALADHAFLRLANSGNVYDLDIVTGRLTLVASATGVAPFLVPELALPGRWLVGGAAIEHATSGFVYTITQDFRAADFKTIFLIDLNKDGSIDLVETSDPSGFYSGDRVIERF